MKRTLKIICAAAFASVMDMATIVLILLGLKALVDTGILVLQLLAALVLFLLALAVLVGAVILLVWLLRYKKKP